MNKECTQCLLSLIIEILLIVIVGTTAKQVLHVCSIFIQKHFLVTIGVSSIVVKQHFLLAGAHLVSVDIILRIVVVVHHQVIREVIHIGFVLVIVGHGVRLRHLLLLVELRHDLFGLEVRVEGDQLFAHLRDHRDLLG